MVCNAAVDFYDYRATDVSCLNSSSEVTTLISSIKEPFTLLPKCFSIRYLWSGMLNS